GLVALHGHAVGDNRIRRLKVEVLIATHWVVVDLGRHHVVHDVASNVLRHIADKPRHRQEPTGYPLHSTRRVFHRSVVSCSTSIGFVGCTDSSVTSVSIPVNSLSPADVGISFSVSSSSPNQP